MKRLTGYLGAFLMNLCIIYACCSVGYAVYGRLSGATHVEISGELAILLCAALIALSQTLCFTDLLFKRMRYWARSLLFFPMCLISVTASLPAWGVSLTSVWQVFGKFMLVFIALFALLTGVFAVSFRLRGKRYDEILSKRRGRN